MTTVEELRALRERLEKAEGPDHDLDCAIGHELRVFTGRSAFYIQPPPGVHPDHPAGMFPNFTSSADETIALVERMLPGWEWGINSDNSAYVRRRESDGLLAISSIQSRRAETPALALCVALLSALIVNANKNKNHGPVGGGGG